MGEGKILSCSMLSLLDKESNHQARRTVARLVPAKGPPLLKGKLTGVASECADDEGCYDTGQPGPAVTTVLLDTHVVQWWSAEPSGSATTRPRQLLKPIISRGRRSPVRAAWFAAHERIIGTIPVRSWLEQLAVACRLSGDARGRGGRGVAAILVPRATQADRLVVYATAVGARRPLVPQDRS